MLTNTFFNYLVIILFGLIIGSFLNVIILRFDELKTLVKGRSHCPKCKTILKWYDLVPFVSFVLLFGKCRYCKNPISFQYPLVELGTALIFSLIYWKFGISLNSLFMILASCVLIVAFVYDILNLMLADWLVYLGILVWIIWLVLKYFFVSHFSFLDPLYGGLALGGFIALLVLVSRERWMGAGDIGLGFLVGLISGWPNVLVNFLASFVLGALFGIVAIVLKQKKLQSQVAFAPFLILGMWIAVFWGKDIIWWYIKVLSGS